MVSATLLSSLTLSAGPTSSAGAAGPFTQAYQKYMDSNPDLEGQKYLVQAAFQEVITQKKGYMPQLVLEGKALAVGQDIKQKGSGVFEDGSADYGSLRAKLELDQPLIDLTLKHKVAEAKAITRIQQGLLRSQESELTEFFVVSFLEALKIAQLESSVDRVIARLESELSKISRSLEENMATVEDVENVKTALVAMRQEKRLMQDQRQRLLLALGLESDDTVGLSTGRENVIKLPVLLASLKTGDSKADVLQAEINAIGSRIKATGKGDLPRLSLYGLLEHDDADGSQFGSDRTLNSYEVGVRVKWNVFDRGVNRSESKKLDYLKKAKEAKLAARLTQLKRESLLSRKSMEFSKLNLDSLNELVKHQASILKATEISYREGGEKSYIQMINAFMVYESQVRRQIHGKFDYIVKQAEFRGSKTTWSQGLVADLDRIFESTK